MKPGLIGLMFAAVAFLFLPPAAAKDTRFPPQVETEAPRVRALLEQGWTAENGRGQIHNDPLAAALYCEAGRLGSAEGYYRVGLLYHGGNRYFRDRSVAAAFFSMASRLGHRDGGRMLEFTGPPTMGLAPCISIDEAGGLNLDQFIAELPLHKRKIAELIKRLAPRYSVDVKLALAVASVESNFNAGARSPKNAQGVMQLIPETAERFNVKNPYNAEQNIRGGLAYLRWLHDYFDGDLVRIIAAYNAGEGAVDEHRGIPPYSETQAYVLRVLHYAGVDWKALLPAKPGGKKLKPGFR